MQPNIAKHVLADLKRRGWTEGRVVLRRKGVCGIDVTTPTGERCEFTTLDDVRLKVRLLSEDVR